MIVQRMQGDLDALSAVAEQIKAEVAKRKMAIIHFEGASPP